MSVLVVVLYVFYLAYTGQRIPVTSDEILQHGSDKFDKIKVDSVKNGERSLRERILEDKALQQKVIDHLANE